MRDTHLSQVAVNIAMGAANGSPREAAPLLKVIMEARG